MSDQAGLCTVTGRYLSLPLPRKLLFLADYSHQITIQARVDLTELKYEGARKANEHLHQISGHSTSLLGSEATERDNNFIEMLYRSADQLGWLNLLTQSLKRSELAPGVGWR